MHTAVGPDAKHSTSRTEQLTPGVIPKLCKRLLGARPESTIYGLAVFHNDACPRYRTGGLYNGERKVHSEAETRSESVSDVRGCRFVVAGGWRLGRNGRGSAGGPAHAKDRTHS